MGNGSFQERISLPSASGPLSTGEKWLAPSVELFFGAAQLMLMVRSWCLLDLEWTWEIHKWETFVFYSLQGCDSSSRLSSLFYFYSSSMLSVSEKPRSGTMRREFRDRIFQNCPLPGLRNLWFPVGMGLGYWTLLVTQVVSLDGL